jgi:hypothetical protein
LKEGVGDFIYLKNEFKAKLWNSEAKEQWKAKLRGKFSLSANATRRAPQGLSFFKEIKSPAPGPQAVTLKNLPKKTTLLTMA